MRTIILVTTIISMNFMGIGHAYWTDSIGINADVSVSTGYIDPRFSDNCVVYNLDGKGDILAYFEDPYTMVIEGEVEPDFMGVIQYGIENHGSIPVKYSSTNSNMEDEYQSSLEQSMRVIYPMSTEFGNIETFQLPILTGPVGRHSINITLPFSQWVGNP
jgi:hypothetical protein